MKKSSKMRILITLLLLAPCANCFSQSSAFIEYKDTTNHFSINIPAGWNYGVNKNYPDLKLIAVRKQINASDKILENFNLNILNKVNSSLDREYKKLISALISTNNFNLLENDSTSINGLPFKWFIESHKNESGQDFMNNYVYLTYKEGKTYILTFVSSTANFEKYKLLFRDIAKSITL